MKLFIKIYFLFMILFQGHLYAVNYKLPNDIGKNNTPFENCTGSNPYTCPGQIQLDGNNDKITLTSDVILTVNGSFLFDKDNHSILTAGYTFTLNVTADFKAKNDFSILTSGGIIYINILSDGGDIVIEDDFDGGTCVNLNAGGKKVEIKSGVIRGKITAAQIILNSTTYNQSSCGQTCINFMVDDDLAQCPTACYRVIQDAVDAASTGQAITICPGTYVEGVSVTSKDSLSFESSTQNAVDVIIDAQSAPGNQQGFLLAGSSDVSFNALTIKGKLPAIQFDSSAGAFEITNSILSSSNDHIIFNSSSPNGFKIIGNSFTNAGNGSKSAIQFQLSGSNGIIKDNNISTNNNSGNGIYFTFIPSNLLVTNNCFENIPDEEGYILFAIFSPQDWDSNYWEDLDWLGVVDNSPLSSCGPPTLSSPTAEYRMDECSWDGSAVSPGWVEDSVGSAHGASKNSVNTVGTASQVGDRSGLFDGIDDYVEQDDLFSLLSTTASLSFWIKTTQNGNNTSWRAPGIIGIEEAGGGDDIFWGWIDASGNIGFTKGNTNTTRSTTEINDDVWHHIVLTWDSITGFSEVYVDGSLEDTGTTETGNVTRSFNRIGSIQDTGATPTFFEGYLDELKVFNSVINSNDVSTIYANELAGKNYDGTVRIPKNCNIFVPKDGNFTAVDIVSTACNAPTHWDDKIQTKIVNDDISLSILALDKATNLPLEANITKVSLVHYPSGNNNACTGVSIETIDVCSNCGLTDIDGCLSLSVNKSFNQRASQCVEILIQGKDKDDTIGTSLSDSNSSDNLAIRPDTYNCDGIVPSVLISEHNYSSTFKAMPLNLTSPSIGYTSNTVSLSAKKYMRTGDLNISLNGSLSSSGLNFIDGNTSVTLSFSDVGDIGIDLNDSVWADVDSDDTAEIDRVIHTECRRVFRADHFEVLLSRPFLENNASTGFTYLANLSPSLKMSAWMKGLDVIISAKGENNATMLNYKAPNTSFYANEVFLSPLVTLPAKHSSATKLPDVMDQNSSDIDSFIFIEGEASYSYENLGFNYDRDFSSPIIPFGVDGNESLFSLSVEDKLYTSVTGSASTDSDNNVSFYYGRLHPSDLITTFLPSNANIVYEVYDNTNSSFTAGMKQSSLFWFINNLHNDQNEGNITLATASRDTLLNNALTGFSFSYNTPSLGRENLGIETAASSRAFIHLSTQQWLWYVPSSFGSAYDDTSGSDCTMHPCFQFSWSFNNTALKVESGDFNGTIVPDVNRSEYIQKGVKLFR